MPKIRVLIVDDAVVVRRMVGDVLAADPDIEVAGAAATGRIALAKIPQVNPDVITLDVEMPDMDGLQTLAQIRKTHPKLPVIMFSTLTERGASATLDALSLGATDYVTKPANVGSVAAALQRIREQLIPKIKLWSGRHAAPPLAAAVARPGPPGPARRTGPVSAVEVVVIGVSTGGPNALAELLPALPADLSVPVLVVQHMPPVFTQLLAKRLDTACKVRVHEASAAAVSTPGTVWIAPGDFHMTVTRTPVGPRLLLNQGPPENSCRPAADVLFRSAASAYGAGVLAVVLTGMGQDGLRGCEAVAEAGGQVLAQDEATSVVWGMPGFVARAGLADRVLPLPVIAHEVVRRVHATRPRAGERT
jgi:two-component system chemotaxis response regulator CheB